MLLAGGLNLLFGQHGGGGHSAGGHSSGGHASSYSSGSRAGFSPVSSSRTQGTSAIRPRPIGVAGYTGYPGINRGALNGGYGRGYRGGFYYLPWNFGDYDNGYGYDNAPYAYNQDSQDYGDQTAAVTGNMLGEQVAQLSSEVQALQNERDVPYAAPGIIRPPYNAPPAMAEDETPSSPPVTLVLRDGKQVQLKSYAVMGQTIWDFSAQPAKRIALASVDLGASRAATEASGGEFPEIQ